MRKAILIILSIFSSELVFAQNGEQVLGIQLGAHGLKDKRFGNNYDTKISPLGGIFYDRVISNRFGVSTGLQARTFEENSVYRFIDYSPFQGENVIKNTYMDLPLNLMVNLSFRETQSWKSYFSFGYNYSLVIFRKTTNLHSGAISQGFTGFDYNWHSHYLNAGLEVRHNFTEKFMLAINPGFCLDLNSFDGFNEDHHSYFYLKVKVGRGWKN